jgi:hypothetical protein
MRSRIADIVVRWVVAFAVWVLLATLLWSQSLRDALIYGAVAATAIPILTSVLESLFGRPTAKVEASVRALFARPGVGLSARRRAEVRRADEARRR